MAPQNQPPKRDESGISEKAFKRMIWFFTLYALLFCIGVVVAVNFDKF